MLRVYSVGSPVGGERSQLMWSAERHKLALLMLTLDNSVAMLGYLTMAFGHGNPDLI